MSIQHKIQKKKNHAARLSIVFPLRTLNKSTFMLKNKFHLSIRHHTH